MYDVIPIYGLSLLCLAPLTGLASNEADELRNALLDGLFSFFGYLGIFVDAVLHDPADVGDGQAVWLLIRTGSRSLLPVFLQTCYD